MKGQRVKDGYEDFLFPKTVRQKERKKHPKSILNTKKNVCYLCAYLNHDYRIKYTEEHHILYGSGQRKNAEDEGIKVDLCLDHHRRGQQAVHNSREMRVLLCRIAQEEYEKTHTREEWMKISRKNYLEE